MMKLLLESQRMSVVKKILLSDSMIYLFSSVLNSLIPFLLLPILTSYLSTDEYGHLGLFQGLYTIFLICVGLNIAGSILKKRFQYDDNEFAKYISNLFLIGLSSTLFVALVLFIFSNQLVAWLHLSSNILWLALGYSAAMFVINVLLAILQVEKRSALYGSFQVSHTLLNLGLGLLFVISFHGGGIGRMLSILCASWIFASIAIIWLYRKNKIKFIYQKNYIREALKFGVPLVPHGLGTFFSNWFSVFIINKYLDASSAGIYLFAFQLSMGLGILCDAFNNAYLPWLFENLETGLEKNKEKVVKLTYLYFAIMMLISFSAFTIGPFVIKAFFNESYWPAGKIIGILVLGQAFGGMYLMVTNYLFYVEKTAPLSIITTLSSLIGVAAFYILIQHFQLVGAAISFLVLRVLIFVLVWKAASMNYKMPWFSVFKDKKWI